MNCSHALGPLNCVHYLDDVGVQCYGKLIGRLKVLYL